MDRALNVLPLVDTSHPLMTGCATRARDFEVGGAIRTDDMVRDPDGNGDDDDVVLVMSLQGLWVDFIGQSTLNLESFGLVKAVTNSILTRLKFASHFRGKGLGRP